MALAAMRLLEVIERHDGAAAREHRDQQRQQVRSPIDAGVAGCGTVAVQRLIGESTASTDARNAANERADGGTHPLWRLQLASQETLKVGPEYAVVPARWGWAHSRQVSTNQAQHGCLPDSWPAPPSQRLGPTPRSGCVIAINARPLLKELSSICQLTIKQI